MFKISITTTKKNGGAFDAHPSHHPDDLPFDKTQGPRFIGWIVAMMVYLASLFFVLSFCASEVFHLWNSQAENGFTVVLAPSDSPVGGVQIKDLSQQWKALEILGRVRGVVKTEVISSGAFSRFSSLLQGKRDETISAPQSIMIDVQSEKKGGIDLTILQELFERELPGATIKTERTFYENMSTLASMGIGISFLVTFLIMACAFAISIFSVHSGLIIHKKIIEILHLVGANNGYIAHQFQRHAQRLGMRGGLIGLLLTVVTLGIICAVLASQDSVIYTDTLFSGKIMLTLCLIPVITTVVMMCAARFTVIWELSKYP